MGQAIVYCWKCQNRLLESDFEAGRAFQVGARSSCADCARELLGSLEGKERAELRAKLDQASPARDETNPPPRASVDRRDPLRPSPRQGSPAVGRAGPPKRPPTKILWAAGGIGLVALLALLVWTLGGEKPRDPSAVEEHPLRPTREPAQASREKAADQAIVKARQSRQNGASLEAQLELWKEAVTASRETSRLPEATQERDSLMARRKEGYPEELSKLESSVQAFAGEGEWKKATGYLRSARARHDDPEWGLAVDRLLGSLLEKEKAGGLEESKSRSLKLVPRAGLVLWLRGDAGVVQNGGSISRWSDQSGNKHDASQNAPAQRPSWVQNAIHGYPAVAFDGKQASLNFTLPVNGLEGMTIFLVSATLRDVGGGTGSDSAILYWDATDWKGKLYVSSFQTGIRFKFGAAQAKGDISFQRPASLGTRPSLTVMRKEGPENTLFVDGTLAARETGMGRTIASCKDQALMGIGKNNTHFSGSIAELLLFGRALPESERQDIERYLMEKYGLPAK